MPVFNEEAFIRSAVSSVLQQTFSSFELLVIDDGSTDSTRSILEELQQKDSRLRIYPQPRIGAIAAFNLGATLARGRYIAWLGGDDIAFHTRFARQVEFLDAHPRVAALGGAIALIDASGALIGTLAFPTQPPAIRAALPHTNPIAAPAAMIRKDVYECIGGCRTPFLGAEDYDLWLRIAERHELANLPQLLVYYRIHDGQVSVHGFEQQALSMVGARVSSRARRNGLSDPLATGQPMDRQSLRQAGMDEASIQAELARQTAARAAVLVSIGRARQSLALLDRIVETDSSGLPPAVQAAVGLTRARALFAIGDLRGSIGRGLAALRVDACYVLRAALRGASTRLSWTPSPPRIDAAR